MKLALLPALTLLLIAQSSSAGIRIIGGGGIGEMKALTFMSRLDQIISPCFKTPELCGLSLEIAEDLKHSGLPWAKKMQVELFSDPDLSQKYRWQPPDPTVYVNSRLLYDGDIPKPSDEIAAAMLDIWLTAHTTTGRFGDTAALAHRIMRGMKLAETESEFGNLKVHTMNLNATLSERQEAFLAIEYPEGTKDITALLRQVLEDHHKLVGRVLEITQVTREGGFFAARARFHDDRSEMAARFAFQVPEQAALEPRFRISGLEFVKSIRAGGPCAKAVLGE